MIGSAVDARGFESVIENLIVWLGHLLNTGVDISIVALSAAPPELSPAVSAAKSVGPSACRVSEPRVEKSIPACAERWSGRIASAGAEARSQRRGAWGSARFVAQIRARFTITSTAFSMSWTDTHSSRE